MKRIASAIDLLLPRICIVCGERLLSAEQHICLGCMAEMPLTYFWKQSHNPMSDRFNEVIQKNLSDFTAREPYAYAVAMFTYHGEGMFRLIPYNIKYKGDVRAGEYFGSMLGFRLMKEDVWKDADIVIPVPLHWTRKFLRGYNQAEAIACGLASAMGIPLRTDILKRMKRTKTQTKLDIEGKSRNVAGAFEVNAKDLTSKGLKHVILVDDVFTTGSTALACFTSLRSVFPPKIRISVVTLAFVADG